LVNVIHQTGNKNHGPKLYTRNGAVVTFKDTDQVYSGNKLDILPVSSGNLLAVQQLVAQLLIEQQGKPIILDTLARLFKKELQDRRIILPFKMMLLKANAQAPPES
jgi:hypothetical protein